MAGNGEHGETHPCDPWSRLRLAGLVPSIISNLLHRRGEPIRAVVECADSWHEVTGILEDAGLGFITIVNGQLATMVPLHRLCAVKWLTGGEPDAPGHSAANTEVG